MCAKIRAYIHNCGICELNKSICNPSWAPPKSRRVPVQSDEVWYLDFFGKIDLEIDLNDMQKKSKRYKYVLVAVDSYSLYTELILCHTTTATETAKRIFERIYLVHSFPRAIVHDSGTSFTGKVFKALSKYFGIKNYQTAAMNPRANGVCEARVKIVSIALAKLVNERHGNWYEHVPIIQYAMNCTPTAANKIAPFVLQTGQIPNDGLSVALTEQRGLLRTHLEYLGDLQIKLKFLKKIVKQCRRKYERKMQEGHKPYIRLPKEVQVGEFCYLQVPFLNRTLKNIRRLTISWRGPYIITDIIDNRLVELARVSDLEPLERRIPIHRIRISEMGIDPPQLINIKGITKDYYDDFTEDDLITPDMVQPWDNWEITDEPVRSEEDSLRDKESSEVNNHSHFPDADSKTSIPDESINTTEINDYQNEPTQSNPSPILVRLAPRARTTRHAPASDEETTRAVAEILGYRNSAKTGEQVKLRCEGDKMSQAFWTLPSSIICDNLPVLIEELKNNKKSKVDCS